MLTGACARTPEPRVCLARYCRILHFHRHFTAQLLASGLIGRQVKLYTDLTREGGRITKNQWLHSLSTRNSVTRKSMIHYNNAVKQIRDRLPITPRSVGGPKYFVLYRRTQLNCVTSTLDQRATETEFESFEENTVYHQSHRRD